MSIYQLIAKLIDNGIKEELLTHRDRIYVQNQLLGYLKLDSFNQPTNVSSSKEETIPDLLDKIIQYAVDKKVIDNVLDEKEILSAKLMNCFLSKPSEINEKFYEKYQYSPKAATDYFYHVSKCSNYIQMKRISKNIQFQTDTPYGELDITINLSKPEKDPEQIKRERAMKKDISYPACVLCLENEGYVGRTGYPARSNHRVIEIPLDDETWFLQYSPYVYYNEHSILFAEEHRPMVINKATFTRLLSFVEKFPHYFIGSNADLPIVGGSILSHDHYQGGRYSFAMTKARDAFTFSLEGYPAMKASVIKWPMSVIRLNSSSKKELIDAATHILKTWKNYSDNTVDIQAYSAEEPHNTITPIARMRDDTFELDLVLRNNRTSDEHPLGIFHPHEDVHHIKKENIGLIEVMGLAVLPARLKEELQEIKEYLLGTRKSVAQHHKQWAEELSTKYSESIQPSNVEKMLQTEVGKKFTKVLEDSGVFKSNDKGVAAFKQFIREINKK